MNFSGKRVLLTGHTGFKGAWLLAWLDMLGANVAGLALAPPSEPSLFALIDGTKLCAAHTQGDIRDAALVRKTLEDFAPDYVVHMAAQTLVLPSLAAPVETFATNLIGTAHVLEACRYVNPKAILIVTSDKVYANDGSPHAFVEADRLGGHDPYSASKAACEIAVDSFRSSYFAGKVPLATARAGNVIGGGDWAAHRIVPDAVRALVADNTLVLRRPEAVRPWQHVLDPLAGYLAILDKGCDGAFNFGPEAAARRTVREVVAEFGKAFDGKPGWTIENANPPPEAPYLTLSAACARDTLGWAPKLDFETSMAWTAAWYRAWTKGEDMRKFTRTQIQAFSKL
jgi:CDP-glucose 4,6-dehydratase